MQAREAVDLARRFALSFVRRFPTSVEARDLAQDALLEWWVKMGRAGDAQLGRQAARVMWRGAIDGLRRLDPLGREDRAKVKRVDAAKMRLMNDGARATPTAIAHLAGMSAAEVNRILVLQALKEQGDGHQAQVVDLDHDNADSLINPDALEKAIARLPLEKRIVVRGRLASVGDQRIADRLGVSTARVSQIHAEAAGDLRRMLAPEPSLKTRVFTGLAKITR
jgi:RNA polymerase sigma factor (sigma-70 family)